MLARKVFICACFGLLIGGVFLLGCGEPTAAPTPIGSITPTPALTLTPVPTATPPLPIPLSRGQDSPTIPNDILLHIGEYYRSDPALVCGGSSPSLQRDTPGETLSLALPQVAWCACSLRGGKSVQAQLTLPDGRQQTLAGHQSLAYSTCYTWNFPLGPSALRGEYRLQVTYRDGQLTDSFKLALPSMPQAVWLAEDGLIWAGGFQPFEAVRALVFSAPTEEMLGSEGAYTVLYQFENRVQADAAGELWLDPGSPAVSAAYRLVVLVGASGRAQAGQGMGPLTAQVLTNHIFNNCQGAASILARGQKVRAAQPLASIYLSSFLLDDEVLDTLSPTEELTLLDGPVCGEEGWRWLVGARKGALQGWMLEGSLTP